MMATKSADETRKVQAVGYSTLTVSIPRQFVKDMRLEAGDSLLFRQDSDGTLRLIPTTSSKKLSHIVIRAEQAGNEETLSKLMVSAYALGYDTIEIAG